MPISKYFALAGESAHIPEGLDPPDSHAHSVRMDGSVFKGCMYSDACWVVKPFERSSFFKHSSDELLVFIGGDHSDPENLNAEVELWIENDRITLTKTSIVFIPAGTAHGRIAARNVRKPFFRFTCHLGADEYVEIPAEATAPRGTYAKNWVERYEPVDGRLPTAPEGFLKLLLWIDGKKLAGAPYMEAVWFMTPNDTGPEEHVHDFDEFIGFIGTDPSNPGDLGAEIKFFIGGEAMTLTKSCLVYIPCGTRHSPILVPRLNRPIIHFSGGNGGDYRREGSDAF